MLEKGRSIIVQRANTKITIDRLVEPKKATSQADDSGDQVCYCSTREQRDRSDVTADLFCLSPSSPALQRTKISLLSPLAKRIHERHYYHDHRRRGPCGRTCEELRNPIWLPSSVKIFSQSDFRSGEDALSSSSIIIKLCCGFRTMIYKTSSRS